MAPPVPEIDDATQVFLKALASETRQGILRLFVADQELTVGEVAQRSGLGHSTASEQLALMRRAGLVTSARDGRTVRYRVNAQSIVAHLDELRDYLLRCCPPR